VDAVVFDGNGMGVEFFDLAEVVSEEGRASLEKAFERDGVHVRVPGLSLRQVEEVRQLLELEAPAPDEPTGRVEELHRELWKATPRPLGTYSLMAVSVVVFAAMLLRGASPLEPAFQTLVRWGGDYAPFTLNGEWWRLFTSLFVHVGLFHLVVNLWALRDLGPLVERLLGTAGFLAIALVSGLAGSVACVAWYKDRVNVGTSGAIFGLFGALLGILLLSRRAVAKELLRQLRWSGLVFLGANIFFGVRRDGVEHPANIAGAAAGLLGGLVLGWRLTPGQAARRALAAAAFAAVACLALGVTVWFLPRPPKDYGKFRVAFAEFEEVQHRVLTLDREGRQRVQNKELTEDKFADLIEKDILPPWRDALHRLTEIQQPPPRYQQAFPVLVEYLRAHEQSWDLLVRAIRAKNQSLADDSGRERERANQKAQEFRQLQSD
jgi:rhomboid protease GluP